jgi:hypothetical protein
MITVEKLIKELQQMDPKRIVVMSKDSEGNSFSPMADLGECSYAEETTWSGSIGLEKLTEKDRKAGYSEGDVVKGKPAVCLWPTN